MSAPIKLLKVFISYARSDGGELAEELVTGLEVAGVSGYLDRHDIAAGEDWERRLDSLIREADTVVFLITPKSIASERCEWEVKRAQDLAKRIIPVVGLPVPDEAVPSELRRLNYIYFRPGDSFARGLARLAEALRLDLDWIREHTRLAELARRWQERAKAEALLLRDDELSSAQAWQGAWRPELPPITDLHRVFIAASVEAQEARASQERQRNEGMAQANAERAEALARREEAISSLRRRTIIAGVGVGSLSLGIVGTVVWAVQQRTRALEAFVRREAARRDIAGQIVAYATSPGQAAMDSNGQRGGSPYSTTLLEELRKPTASLWSALSVTSMRVSRDTSGRQRPFVSSDMNGYLYLDQPSSTRRQKALVIAVGRFPEIQGMPPLDGVYRDLAAWSGFLRDRHFEVTELRDPTHLQMTEALGALKTAEASPSASPVLRVGLRLPGTSDGAPSKQPAPPDTLLMLVYSGLGFLSGAQRFLAGTDLKPGFAAGPESASKIAISVADLEAGLRDRAAASVLVYDTNFF